ncbi:MAG: peptidoglycan-binding protein [Methylococcales bacterium]
MNQEYGFEANRFKMAAEFHGTAFENEQERGYRPFSGGTGQRFRSNPQVGKRPNANYRMPTPKSYPSRQRRPWGIIGDPYRVISAPNPVEDEPVDSERTRWIQDCLNRVLDLQLPVTGFMDAGTRSAVRSFQRRQAIYANGLMDPVTEQALRTQCSGVLYPNDAEPYKSLRSQNSELSFSEMTSETEFLNEELQISAPYEVKLKKGAAVSLSDMDSLRQLPTQQGIYLIHINGRLWYIGKADSIRGRFQDRFKTFNDFNIPLTTYSPWLRQVRVSWYLLSIEGSEMARGIKSRLKGSKAEWSPVTAKRQALLRAVEQHFIHKQKPPGNKATECVQFERTGALRLVYSDRPPEIMNTSIFCNY